MNDNQRYHDLYVQRRRLMSMGARENANRVEELGLEMKALIDQGQVTQEAIDNAKYVPWR